MYRFIFLLLLPLLFACNDPNAISSICAKDSALCDNLNQDDWCVPERESLIRSRLKVKNTPSPEDMGKNQYRLLQSINTYQSCISIVSLIEPRQHSQLKTQRVEAMLTTYDELIELEKQTAASDNPYLLYYHWQYKNNDEAKYKLLAQSQDPIFNSAELQFALANIYSDRKTHQTILSLLKGISLVDKSDMTMMTTIHYALITAYMNEKKYKLAYLWSKTAINLEIENISLAMFENTDKISWSERKIIDELAQEIADKISNDEFADDQYNAYLSSAQF